MTIWHSIPKKADSIGSRLLPIRRGLFCLIALGASLIVHFAWAGELVQVGTVAGGAKAAPLLGYLTHPEGPGPFPAVIILHGCTGLSGFETMSADILMLWGYAALAIDSLGPRGISDACAGLEPAQAEDAELALAYLAKQSFINAGRVAVLGYSMGAHSALADVERGAIEQLSKKKFRAAVAYYPDCHGLTGVMTVPTLILIGDRDDWTPVQACRDMAQRASGKGAALELVVYPGAYHAFNIPWLSQGMEILGHHLKYDSAAARDARKRVRAFLDRYLRDGGAASGDTATKKAVP